MNGDIIGSILIISAVIALILIGFVIWFLPVFIAKKRQTDDRGVIMVLSLLGIFCGITWIIALCMACFKDKNKNKN